MRKLAAYWRDDFDWPARERELNKLPHFRASIDGYVIHFIHAADHEDAMPLLLTHGWPGSFVEFLPLIRLLQADGKPRFHIVVPSIPGFAFSERSSTEAPSLRRVAQLWLELMTSLGYERFLVQGGDFGAGVSTWIARLAPERVIGLHLNFLPGSYRPHISADEPLNPEEIALAENSVRWREEEGAYAHLHRTRPWTPAYALSDSPIGLAAWIVEKFYHWGDRRGQSDEPAFSFDDLLTNISLYWFTNTIRFSMEFYRDSNLVPLTLQAGERILPRTAYAAFPKETWVPPETWIKRGYNLARYTRMPYGGHFAALEAPNLLADDLRDFAASCGA